MYKKHPLNIEPYSGGDFTQVIFTPDYKRFDLEGLTPDIIALFKKRVYDLAGVLKGKVTIYLNDELIPIKNFEDYIDMYLADSEQMKLIYQNKRWEVIVSASEGTFKQVSFVNSVSTSKGGTHVNYVMDQIIEKVLKEIRKLKPRLSIKNYIIKNNLSLFINCLIENPSFDS